MKTPIRLLEYTEIIVFGRLPDTLRIRYVAGDTPAKACTRRWQAALVQRTASMNHVLPQCRRGRRHEHFLTQAARLFAGQQRGSDRAGGLARHRSAAMPSKLAPRVPDLKLFGRFWNERLGTPFFFYIVWKMHFFEVFY